MLVDRYVCIDKRLKTIHMSINVLETNGFSMYHKTLHKKCLYTSELAIFFLIEALFNFIPIFFLFEKFRTK
jgi:hypothetical protein